MSTLPFPFLSEPAPTSTGWTPPATSTSGPLTARDHDCIARQPEEVRALFERVINDTEAVEGARSRGYNDGYDAGHEEGYGEGQKDGDAAGHERGYKEGKAEGIESGKELGWEDGYKEGQAELRTEMADLREQNDRLTRALAEVRQVINRELKAA